MAAQHLTSMPPAMPSSVGESTTKATTRKSKKATARSGNNPKYVTFATFITITDAITELYASDSGSRNFLKALKTNLRYIGSH